MKYEELRMCYKSATYTEDGHNMIYKTARNIH